jgi:2-methylcitrate dehydratase PrpD
VCSLHLGGTAEFPAILDDPAFARMRACITVRVDPHLEFYQPDGRGAVVTITTVSGTTVSCRVDHTRGHSLRGGATWPGLSGKWRDALADFDVGSWIAVAQGLDDP